MTLRSAVWATPSFRSYHRLSLPPLHLCLFLMTPNPAGEEVVIPLGLAPGLLIFTEPRNCGAMTMERITCTAAS
jgi:hypothetical protein